MALKLLVTSPEQATAECTITTSLATLNKIRSEHQLIALIKADELDIDGDIKLAQQFAALAENIDIDWGSAIEAQVGDVAAHKLMTLAKKVKEKVSFATSQISADASEYVLHEQRLVVAAAELDRFAEQVTRSQTAIGQLEQRISST